MNFRSNIKPKNLGINNLFGTSNFEYMVKDGFLLIEDLDLDNGASVTNDMDNVLKSLATKFDLYKMKIVYMDSDRRIDAVLIDPDSIMFGIASLNALTFEEAMIKYDQRVENQTLKIHSAFNPC